MPDQTRIDALRLKGDIDLAAQSMNNTADHIMQMIGTYKHGTPVYVSWHAQVDLRHVRTVIDFMLAKAAENDERAAG